MNGQKRRALPHAEKDRGIAEDTFFLTSHLAAGVGGKSVHSVVRSGL